MRMRKKKHLDRRMDACGELLIAQPEALKGRWRQSFGAGPETVLNLEIGCGYLARGMRRWSGYRAQTELALAQYNAGESRADRWKPASPDGTVVDRIGIGSTRQYVTRIMKRYRKYRESMK